MQAEYILRCGSPDIATGYPRILVVPPIFDEANRLRRTLVLAMRALADLGFASMMPDLPGLNDSLVPTIDASLDLWRNALSTVVAQDDQPLICVSVRSACLIDDKVQAQGWWRLAPITGASVVRTMMRTRVAGDREAGIATSMDSLQRQAQQEAVELAGNLLSPPMIDQLANAVAADVSPLRTVTLGVGPDRLPGSALWLRAEPGEDAAMAQAMARDIAVWAQTCAAA